MNSGAHDQANVLQFNAFCNQGYGTGYADEDLKLYKIMECHSFLPPWGAWHWVRWRSKCRLR